MNRLLWCARYALLALRSRYEFTLFSAWQEAWASWEMNDQERGDEIMPTPREAIQQDAYEWRFNA